MILETLLIVGSVTMIMLIMMLKVRDHCHIAEKYRGSEHKDWNYLIMQELGKTRQRLLIFTIFILVMKKISA